MTAGVAATAAVAAPRASRRVQSVDLARALALAGMVVFHFTDDLEMFGFLPPGTTVSGGWAVFARLVAGTFIFLAGVSLVLAQGPGLRPSHVLRRLAMIAAAAALISAATWVVFPDRFIFFGILHSIAVSSVLGLLFLRLPAELCLAAAAGVLALHMGGVRPFATFWLSWTGLSSVGQPSLDFLPVVPWFAPFLAGMALAKRVDLRRHDLPPLTGAAGGAVRWASHHSLALYLLHQPVLLGLIWAALQMPG